MADDSYLPPVVAEIILRTGDFASGAAQIRSEMVSTAASLDAEADKASQSTLKIGASAQSAADLASRANLKIVTSAREAGAAAAAQAAEMGKSSTEIAAAAGRAAEEYTVAQSKMTTAQKAAGLAAAEGAAAAKASADEQEAAYARAAAAAEVEGEKISASQKYLGESLANSGLAIGGALGRPLRGFGRQIEETQHQARSFVGTLSEIGKVVTYGGILGFVGAAYEGVKAATAYQTSLAQIAADSGQGNANAIGKAFLGTLGSSAFSAAQLAQSYAQVSQQLKVVEGGTLNAAAATKVMAASSDLAKGAQTDLGTATSAVAQIMQAYHLGVGQASQAADALYSTSRATGSAVDEISQAMSRLHARLGAITPSLRDVGGLMVGVAQTGLTGSRGILQVSSAMQNLLGGSTAVQTALQELTGSANSLTNSSGGFIGMQAAITKLHAAFAGLSPQIQLMTANTLFGKSAAETMLQVIDKGSASFQKDAQAADRAGSAHAAAAAQGKTLADQLEVIKATLDDLAVAFGQVFIPILQKAGTAIASVVNWFEKNKVAAEILAGVITGVLGAAVAVFVATKVASLYSSLSTLVVGFGKVAATIGSTFISGLARADAAIQGFGVASGEAATSVGGVGVASAAATPEVVGLDVALGPIVLTIAAVGAAAITLGNHWGSVMSAMTTAVNVMVEGAESALNGLISVLNKSIELLTFGLDKNAIGKVGVGPAFSSGAKGPSLAEQQKQTQSAVEKWLKSPVGSPLLLPGETKSGIHAQVERIKQQAEAHRQTLIQERMERALERLAHPATGVGGLSVPAATQAAAVATVQTTQVTDETKIATDAAAAQVAIVKDQQTLVSQAMQAAAKNISDSAAVMTARMSAAATAITDASTVGQDKSSAIVTAMSDATKVQADILGERMLYGYELVAQRLQVQLDATKEGFDKQIAVAQEHLDEDKQHWDGRIAAATINEARVTQHEDQLVAMAQQRETQVQLHADTLLGAATNQSDTVQLAADMRTALAQQAVTLSASASPGQKLQAQQALTLAQAQGGLSTANAAEALSKVTASTSLATTTAAGAYQRAQDTAATAEAKSSATLSKIQGQAQINEAKDQAKLDKLNETMNKVVQKLQDQITLAQAGGGRRIKSDATSLAYTGLGAYGKGGGGNIVNNLGPAATGVGIAQETATERRRARGGKERKGGDVHIHGNVNVHGSTDQQRHDWYLQTRSSMGSLVS